MKVIKYYLYNLSYQILTIILPIITVSYVTGIFTSEDLGNYGFYNSIVSYFLLFGYIGASITAVIVEFLAFIIQWYYCHNIINKKLLFNKDLAKIILSSLVMFGAVMLCKSTLGLDGIVGLVIWWN